MFSLDHVHYTRWLPVHIRDMRNVKERHPELYQEFKNKKIVVQKSNRKISMIAMDQNQEQQNAIVKGVGGVVGPKIQQLYDDGAYATHTDVVVIALSCYHDIFKSKEMLIEFGIGKYFRFITIHDMASELGEDSCKALLFYMIYWLRHYIFFCW